MKKVDKIGLGPNEEKLGIDLKQKGKGWSKVSLWGAKASHFSASFHPQNNRLFLFSFYDL